MQREGMLHCGTRWRPCPAEPLPIWTTIPLWSLHCRWYSMCIVNIAVTAGWVSGACTLPIQHAAFTASVTMHEKADRNSAWKRDRIILCC